ncbi:MAG: hypothetical protein AB1411_10340 [Nitrospirota bacterium]
MRNRVRLPRFSTPAVFLLAAIGLIVGSRHALAGEEKGARAYNEKAQAELDLRHLWNFDKDKPGGPPAGFIALTVGAGQAGGWTVEADPLAPSAPNRLSQTVLCPGGCYQLLLAEGVTYDYVDLTVRLRVVSGTPATTGATGGAVFRVKDERNFHAALVDLAAQSLEVIRVVDGQATVLAHEPVKLRPGAWHPLRVLHETILSKDLMEISFDGKIVFSTWDQERYGGRIGLATRGDAAIGFDNFHVIRLYSQKPLSPPAAY